MELTKGEFSQFSLEGRNRLLASYGTILARKKYALKTFTLYRIFDFYVNKSTHNEDKTVMEIEIISESLARQFFLDN